MPATAEKLLHLASTTIGTWDFDRTHGFGLQRRDGLIVGLKGLGDARRLDVVEALDEPDSPTQTLGLVIGGDYLGTQSTQVRWLAPESSRKV